jgi:RNA polymerase sigma-70 factor, ECF subfamily
VDYDDRQPTTDLTGAVRDAQRGDEEAFRTVYRTVQPGLLRYLRFLVGDDADDVASEAWLQVVRDLGSFRGDFDGFRGWVATIARNRAMDHLRRQRRRPNTGPIDQVGDLPSGEDAARLALDNLSTGTALAMLAALPRDQAEAVYLRVVLGLDATEAARVLGKRAGAVRTAAYRGLRALARRLQPAGEPVAEPAGGKQGAGRPGRGRKKISPEGVTKRGASTLRTTR